MKELMSIIPVSYLAKITIPGLDIELNIPTPGGLFAGGVFSGIGTILSLVFTFFILIWVFLSIYAAIKIISSQGSEEMQKGVEIVKNIWIGISMGIAFFLILSALGSFLGIGGIYDWTKNLKQCNGFTDDNYVFGGYFFKDVQQQKVIYEMKNVGYSDEVYCCEVKEDLILDNYKFGIVEYYALDFEKGYHWIIVIDGNSPDQNSPHLFANCRQE